jgi:hypothetical protein
VDILASAKRKSRRFHIQAQHNPPKRVVCHRVGYSTSEAGDSESLSGAESYPGGDRLLVWLLMFIVKDLRLKNEKLT